MGGHAPVLVCGNLYVVLTTLTSVLGKGCLHTAIGSRTLSLPPFIYSWYKVCTHTINEVYVLTKFHNNMEQHFNSHSNCAMKKERKQKSNDVNFFEW